MVPLKGKRGSKNFFVLEWGKKFDFWLKYTESKASNTLSVWCLWIFIVSLCPYICIKIDIIYRLSSSLKWQDNPVETLNRQNSSLGYMADSCDSHRFLVQIQYKFANLLLYKKIIICIEIYNYTLGV